jgi:ferrous iron transport protein B
MIDLNVPIVIALNMYDLSLKRGQEINIEKLSSLLNGTQIVPTVATRAEGIDKLDLNISELIKKEKSIVKTEGDFLQKIKTADYIKSILERVDSIIKQVTVKTINKDTLTEKLDSIVLHPILGPFVLMAVLIFLFQLLFVWADPFVGLIEYGFEILSGFIDINLTDGYLKSLLIDGIIAGVGGIVVFLPHIVFLFILINTLEDFGYLGRAAFLLDFMMRKVGLPGKAVIPLLSSHACAIPGIMGARIIENPRQRLVTIMLSPLMACSARLPVYTLLIAAIVPN